MRKDGQSWEGLSWRKNVDLFSSILQLCEEEKGKKNLVFNENNTKKYCTQIILFIKIMNGGLFFFLIVTEPPALLPSLQLSLNHYHAVVSTKRSTCLLL